MKFLLLIGVHLISSLKCVPVVKMQEIEAISRKDFYMPLNLRPEQVPIEAGHFIAGFTDGEGNFSFTGRKREDSPCGWKFSLCFNISQNDKTVLLYCQKFLGCGSVRENRPGKFVFEVASLEHIEKYILPFFQRFQFRSVKKRREFRVFQVMVRDFLTHGTITTLPRLLHFLKLRKLLGELREERNKNPDEVILASFVCQRNRPRSR